MSSKFAINLEVELIRCRYAYNRQGQKEPPDEIMCACSSIPLLKVSDTAVEHLLWSWLSINFSRALAHFIASMTKLVVTSVPEFSSLQLQVIETWIGLFYYMLECTAYPRFTGQLNFDLKRLLLTHINPQVSTSALSGYHNYCWNTHLMIRMR